MDKNDLDPWRVLRSLFAKIKSHEVPDIIDRAGLRVDWSLTEKENYSHSLRWTAYRPRIDAAYEALKTDEERLRVVFIVAGEPVARGHQEELDSALRRIGWKLRGSNLEPVEGTVRELFFPDTSEHDAYVKIRAIIQSASTSLDIIDPYVDGSTLTLLGVSVKDGVIVRLLTSKHPTDFELETKKWRRQHKQKTLDVRTTMEFHDRFIVVDGMQCWHVGCSIKDAGNKAFMLNRIEDQENTNALLGQIRKSWSGGTTF